MSTELSPTPSRAWRAFFHAFYRLIHPVEPLLERWLARRALGDTVEVRIVGRRTGLERPVLLGLLVVGGRWYVGHPAGDTAWTLNLEAAGEANLVLPRGRAVAVRSVALAPGPERDAAIRATFRQHPFPGNVLYWLSRRNLFAVGRYFRLEPVSVSSSEPGPPAR